MENRTSDIDFKRFVMFKYLIIHGFIMSKPIRY